MTTCTANCCVDVDSGGFLPCGDSLEWQPLPRADYPDNPLGIVQLYTGGTSIGCEDDPARMSIDFLCDQAAGVGKPTAKKNFGADHDHSCHFEFVWRSKFACPINK